MQIRNDDVLQASLFTPHQLRDINGRDLFGLFLEADSYFENFLTQTLAIVSEGIEAFPEWVEHIKKNKQRYDIQLHGERHYNYKHLPEDQAIESLKRAKAEIERVFEVEVNTWYPPFGRKGTPKNIEKICEKVGLDPYIQVGKVDAKLWFKNPEKYQHVNFHFWNDKQVQTVKEIICQFQGGNSRTG